MFFFYKWIKLILTLGANVGASRYIIMWWEFHSVIFPMLLQFPIERIPYILSGNKERKRNGKHLCRNFTKINVIYLSLGYMKL